MITPGIAASLTPTSVERTPVAPRPRRRRHLPHVRLHLPHLKDAPFSPRTKPWLKPIPETKPSFATCWISLKNKAKANPSVAGVRGLPHANGLPPFKFKSRVDH